MEGMAQLIHTLILHSDRAETGMD